MVKLPRIISVLLLFFSGFGFAVEFAGEIKLQQLFGHTDSNSLQANLAAQEYAITQSSFRWSIDHQQSKWSFDLDYLLSAQKSSDLSALQITDSLASNTLPQTDSWFDLQTTSSTSNSSVVEQRLDRASIKYSAERWILQFGRQALTWGNGVVFHPMDILNPFSPDSKDTSYKTGVDSIYSQYLFESGADLQMFWVPRKQYSTQQLDSKFASLGIKYLFFIDNIQIDVMLAEDYQQTVFAFGFNGPLRDAIWRFDVVSNQTQSEGNAVSVDLNIQSSWMLAEKPVSGFIEYYRNGFAKDKVANLQQISAELNSRLQRGTLFSINRDNLVIGAQLQWSPLVFISTSLINQLNDNSRLFITSLTYNSSQSSNLVAGAQIAYGKQGSQYGGLYIDATEQIIIQPADQLYVRYEWFF